MRHGRSRGAAEVLHPVQGDLAGPTLELLQYVRSRAGAEGEWRARAAARQRGMRMLSSTKRRPLGVGVATMFSQGGSGRGQAAAARPTGTNAAHALTTRAAATGTVRVTAHGSPGLLAALPHHARAGADGRTNSESSKALSGPRWCDTRGGRWPPVIAHLDGFPVLDGIDPIRRANMSHTVRLFVQLHRLEGKRTSISEPARHRPRQLRNAAALGFRFR